MKTPDVPPISDAPGPRQPQDEVRSLNLKVKGDQSKEATPEERRDPPKPSSEGWGFFSWDGGGN